MLAIILSSAILSIAIIAVGGAKGLRALLSLLVTLLVLIKGIVPAILHGVDPVVAVLLGGVPVIVLIIYMTEGWNRRAHLAIASIFIISAIIIPLTWGLVRLSGITGYSSEEMGYVAGYGTHAINVLQLVFAGIILGTLGALCESVVAQVSTVEQLLEAATTLTPRETYRRASAIGVAHLSAVITTLFLIYASVSLPLLIIFIGGTTHFGTILQSEIVLTDLIRTAAGAIAITLSIPIATALGIRFLSKKYA